MGDSYQPIYDAVRSRITGGDVGQAVRDSINFDISPAIASAQTAICNVELEMIRPSVLFRPKLSIDGNQWCALYGDNLQEGIAGFGNSPDQAMRSFDESWTAELVSKK